MAEKLTDDGWGSITIAIPPELMKLGVRPDLQRFWDAMVYKLRRNHTKGKWETLPMESAVKDLDGEVEELKRALLSNSTSEILMESCDVANEALIVASIALEARGVR